MSLTWALFPSRGRKSGNSRAKGATAAHSARRRVAFDHLEDRTLMSGTPFHPTFQIYGQGPGAWTPLGGGGPGGGFTPAQVRKAYGFDSVTVGGVTGDGSGQTIAIVDAFDQPNIIADLKAFDTFFGLPDPPSFQVLNQNGLPSPLPSADAPGGWGVEISLDVEWAHSMAPKANIILVEANQASTVDLIQTAVPTAAGLPGVSEVSMSFGGGEGGRIPLNPIFTTPAGHAGVTFLASTGDSGAPGGYPAFAPTVVAVGGTSLFNNPDDSYQGESGWSGSGGGISIEQGKPGFQSALPYTARAIPDVSLIADPNTGVSVYDTYDFGTSTPWQVIGGTSLACPAWAGLMAIVNQERVANGDTVLDGAADTLPMIYKLPAADFNDITTGNNGFPAGPGYDLVTGIGTPKVPAFVRDMAPLHLSLTMTPIGATVGKPLTNVEVARFTDKPSLLATSKYSAVVDWGDGTIDSGVSIVDSGLGYYRVIDSHTYTAAGTYTIKANVTNTVTSSSAQGTEPIVVSDSPLTAIPTSFTTVVAQTYTGTVGSFSDPNPFALPSDFTASIDWGSGKVSGGTITRAGTDAAGNLVFNVTGTTSYNNFGTYAVKTKVSSGGGSTLTIVSVGDVLDAAITATNQSFLGIEGTAFSSVVASFTSANPRAVASNFTATVDWGDGTGPSGAGVSIVNRGTRFDVVAGYDYSRFGSYPVKVVITSAGGVSATTTSTAGISDAPVGAQASNFTTTEGTTFSGTVATVTDSNPFGVATDYAGTTINWGDGTPPTPATNVVSLGASKFGIQGSHTYTTFGNYVVTTQVVSAGGSKANASATASVQDAALTARGVPDLSALAGRTVGGTVATFHVAYPLAPIGNYTATVDWGDGTTPAPGAITGANGDFTVTASHAYAKAQTYPVRVFVASAGGSNDTAQSNAVIGDPPVIVTQTALGVQTQGTPFGGTIATLSTGNGLASTTDYIASIDWGDGKSTGGLLTPTGGGNFNISSASPHAFDTPGNYSVTTTVISLGGNRGSASGPASVTPAPILLTPGDTIQTVAGALFSGTVATFTQFAQTPVSAFNATIDWGNGNTSPGVVTANKDGSFSVSGSNTFALNGPSTVTVTVGDTYGSTADLSLQAGVADAALTSAGSRLSTVFGQPFSGTVATFTSANPLALPGEFAAVINWGDGSPPTLGVVGGGNGSFSVVGAHTFAAPAAAVPVNVVITHTGKVVGNVTSATTFARVILPISGSMTRASDSGPSNTDGFTNVKTPSFTGRAEPGAPIRFYAAPNGNTAAQALVGTTTADSFGNWAVQISPLADGAYTFFATMSDPIGGAVVQTTQLAATPANGPLFISTSGPTVAGVSLDAAHAQLHVLLQGGLDGLNVAGLVNAANFGLALPAGLGLQPLAPSSLGLALAGPGQVMVNVTYNGGRALGAGGYVVTLNALGLTDLAGNMLRENHFVTFPQATNYPNPNYVAQIDVAKTGSVSAPHLYVSIPEQNAANNYSNYSQSRKTIRVPKVSVPRGPSARGKR